MLMMCLCAMHGMHFPPVEMQKMMLKVTITIIILLLLNVQVIKVNSFRAFGNLLYTSLYNYMLQ